MLPISAIVIILSTLAIYLRQINKYKKTAIFVVCFLLVLGLITVLNSVTKTDLFYIKFLGVSIDPKIVVHISSIELILINLSILFLFTTKKYLHIASEILALITFIIAAIFFIGYTYGIGSMQHFNGFSSIAFQTAICLLIISFLVLKISPQKKIIGVFLEPTSLSTVSSRYLLVVYFLIFFIGWIRLWGQRFGYYGTEVGLGIMIIIFMILCFVILREGVIVIKRKENEKLQEQQLKLQSEINLKRTLDRIEQGFISLDSNWNYTYINHLAGKVMDRNPDEMLGKNIWKEFPETIGHDFHKSCYEAIEKKQSVAYESYYPPFKKWFEYNIYPTEKGISVLFKDITERKEAEDKIIKSNQRFALINLATSEALWENNLLTGEFWANELHQKLYGLTIKDAVPSEQEWLNRIHPDERDAIKKFHDNNFTSKENIFNCEYRFLSTNNKYINIYDSVYFLRNENGEPIRIMGNMRDITSIKEIEQKLATSQNHLRTILDTAPLCIKLLNKDGSLLEMNKQGLQIIQANNFEEIENKNILHLIKNEYIQPFKKLIEDVFKGENRNLQFEIIGLKGKHYWLESFAVPLLDKDGNIVSLLSVTNDITLRKQVELELEKSYQSIQELTQHLQNIRENERVNISREIHDELGQLLVAMKMNLVWLIKKLNIDDEQIKLKFKEVLDLINLMIKSVRKISFDLRPYSLTDLGLNVAIDHFLKEFESRSEIKINKSSSIEGAEISNEISTALFRIIQEACTNIAKHAQAKNVYVSIYIEEKMLHLTIEDDGIGFNLKDLPSKKTLGIIGMKERVKILKGSYQLNSEINKGTLIEITIPIE